jgi:hypothetical protein
LKFLRSTALDPIHHIGGFTIDHLQPLVLPKDTVTLGDAPPFGYEDQPPDCSSGAGKAHLQDIDCENVVLPRKPVAIAQTFHTLYLPATPFDWRARRVNNVLDIGYHWCPNIN